MSGSASLQRVKKVLIPRRALVDIILERGGAGHFKTRAQIVRCAAHNPAMIDDLAKFRCGLIAAACQEVRCASQVREHANVEPALIIYREGRQRF
jgi:hypothetical protein